MEKYTIEGKEGSSNIVIGNSFDQIKDYIPDKKVFVITDTNVAGYYRNKFPLYPIFEVTPGEISKELGSLSDIYHWLLDEGADRESFVLAVGGGVVCDLAGFVASTFMRGLRFGFIATTLLAQVDASVGGKNGVNLGGYKNIVGTFTQPEFVICDTGLLKTLPDEEYRNGLAEIIKHALIRDADKFLFLETRRDAVIAKDRAAIDYLVSRSVQIKAAVVQADEREKGERRLLNFGHTWGHAIEKVSRIPHGQAVSVGIVFAANLSVKKGLLTEGERDRIVRLLQEYGLPIAAEINHEVVFDAMLRDKKKTGNIMHFVLLQGIGKGVVREIEIEELKEFAV
jgi:3-dehydroquinate synthase